MNTHQRKKDLLCLLAVLAISAGLTQEALARGAHNAGKSKPAASKTPVTAPVESGNIPFFSTTNQNSPSNPNPINTNLWYVSDGWTNGSWQVCEWLATHVTYASGNLQLTLDNKGGTVSPYGCGEIQHNQLTGYGRYEATLRTAAGSGLNTAFFTYIGPPLGVPQHDEIDMEFIGKVPTTVDITVWTDDDSHGPSIRVPLGFDASKAFHTYAFQWSKTSILFYADNKLIYQTAKKETMPSHPGHIYFDLWSGGAVENDWMGPFVYNGPVNAQIASVKFTPSP